MFRFAGASSPDPFVVGELVGQEAYKEVAGRSVRSFVINPALKTLVLIVAGQSQRANLQTNFYSAAHAANIDNLSPYDGLLYAATSQLIGTSYAGAPGILMRLADALIANGKFDRVILAPVAIGGSSVADWASGPLSSRIPAAIKRLTSRGITPSTTGVTFALYWAQGEQDAAILGTSQGSYVASFNAMYANAVAAGFSGRTFVELETYYIGGSISATIRAAQAAVVNGTTIFQGGDTDTLDESYRGDTLHFISDTAAIAVATLDYSAMAASGAPF